MNLLSILSYEYEDIEGLPNYNIPVYTPTPNNYYDEKINRVFDLWNLVYCLYAGDLQ